MVRSGTALNASAEERVMRMFKPVGTWQHVCHILGIHYDIIKYTIYIYIICTLDYFRHVLKYVGHKSRYVRTDELKTMHKENE